MASTAVIRQSDIFIDGYAIAYVASQPTSTGCMQCVHLADRVLIDRAPTPTLLSEERGPRCRRSPFPSVPSYIRYVSTVRRSPMVDGDPL